MAENKNIALTSDGKALSAFIGGGVMLLSIGVLNFLSELSATLHDALELYKPVGPYSGKILFGVLCGIIAWIISGVVLRGKSVDAKSGFAFFIAALLIATLFTFTPFIDLFVGKE